MVAALLADLFESHRAHLLSVAYRLTGSVGDAEDAVQESFLRLAGTHQSEIDDLRAWLTTVVSRICLDRLRSAASRRETYVGQWLPEPIVTGVTPSSTPDPLESVVRGQEYRLAAMVVLDELTPPQRVAFVLHDGLSVPFDEIAEILGVTSDAARQLAVRARKAVAGVPAPVSDDEHEAAVHRLLAALATGDVAAVARALHPDAVLIGDANGTTSTAVNIVGGAEKIARFMLGLVRKYGIGDTDQAATRYEFATVNGQLGLVMNLDSETEEQDWHPARVVGFTVRDGLVWGTYDHANPAKLTGVRLS
ncbi:RNA polymerase sigma-70 factor, ECF subfamily [Nocardia amikacinitolerans]|uniref:sigma-70 family RNA polymerase sigma factor n=1 Tax=Nocardia amikacinitolerans TaxID=756689 RepID=UPI000834231D|nr:sigma-70 family RNA polymerase sigma factor [Nocardia amikacinitolerans]MCP2317384.1 RNA polymerase sigma-70 factor, ECF subfamily [Nocardia amikacinitolerans]